MGADAEHAPELFDAEAFITDALAALSTDTVDGIVSSSDYPGCLVAAFISRELGLPGPSPRSVLRCSHKYYSRIAQREAAPEATPRFALVDPYRIDRRPLELPFPVFVKPVKSWFSQHARRVNNLDELRRYVRQPALRAHLAEFVRPFNQLLSLEGGFAFDGGYLIAEEIIVGNQVTLEGFVVAGHAQVVGILDSVMYEGTISFERFEYPSTIADDVSERMRLVIERVLRHIEFDTGLFNVELRHDPTTDEVWIVEINPRMCSQWADLMERVNGTNTYEILFAVAAGDDPPPVSPSGDESVATSFVLRRFEDAIVVRAPSEAQLELVRSSSLVTSISSFYGAQQRLSQNLYQWDGDSYRYAVVNMAGPTRWAVNRGFEAVSSELGFEFASGTR